VVRVFLNLIATRNLFSVLQVRDDLWPQAHSVSGAHSVELSDGGSPPSLANCFKTCLTSPPPPQSVRKDIECCFGILKMRFCILSRPLMFAI